MYAITGITGHVGGAAARTLLAANEKVRAVVRDLDKGKQWADFAVADFTDRAALAGAFTGAQGVFVLLPTVPPFTDEAHRSMADTIAGAVADSGVPHVVMLSSIGADLADGNGPIRWLHHLEEQLRGTRVTFTAIRAPHFQEKVESVLDAAVGAGVFPVFAESADVAVPMVATRDIGAAVARALTSPPSASEVIDLDAPSYTEREVAAALGRLLGKELNVITIPRAGWHGALTEAGLPPLLATEIAALYEADEDGRLQPHGDRRERCTTSIEETLRDVVKIR
ncbi:NAD(P)H-binding protein [Actinoplanes sp. NBC_00393]|uniref:NmrA family NAD(P)-binding protein n=1 Tax=Actinoplanes sp. NBC_00393 TaxID=2975953 RepID=UPI002E233B61